jgi:hypothetical protein
LGQGILGILAMCGVMGYNANIRGTAVKLRTRKVALLISTTALYVAGIIGLAAALPPVTLSCPDAGGAVIFLLNLDTASVVSATGKYNGRSSSEVLFKDVPIHATETTLTWRWIQNLGIRTYEFDRNTLELKAIYRANVGQERSYFEFKCHLARQQL